MCATQEIKLAVVCEGAFLRDSIIEKVEMREIRTVGAISCASMIDQIGEIADIGLFIDTLTDQQTVSEQANAMVNSGIDKWLIVGSRARGSLYDFCNDRQLNISVVPMDVSGREIAHAICLAVEHERICISSSCAGCPALANERIQKLELEGPQHALLDLLTRGHSNKEIAGEFDCEVGQVKANLRRLLATLSVKNRTQAAVYGARAGYGIEGTPRPEVAKH